MNEPTRCRATGTVPLTPAMLEGLPRQSRKVAVGIALVTLAVGSTVLIGWQFDLPALKSLMPTFVSMKANTASGIVLAGLALLLRVQRPTLALHQRVAGVCAAVVVLLGLLTLSQYVLGVDLGLDQLLFQEPLGTVGTLSPGRMAPISAVNFVVIGGALVLLGGHRTLLAAQWLSLLAALLGLLPLLGYGYGAPGLFGLGHYTQMAIHTAATFLLLGLGGLLVHPEVGVTRLLTSATPAGMLLRRVLPFLVGMPALLGYLWALGERLHYFEGPLGVALAMVVLMACLVGLISWTANGLNRLDALRRQAEALVRENAEEIRATLYGIGEGVIATDAGGRVLHMNPVAERLTGWQEAEAVGKALKESFRIVCEETRVEAENPVARILREGQVIGLANHTLLLAKDGTERAIADSGAPVFDEQGNLARVVLVFRDQTAERASQRALAQSEVKYRRLHECLWDAYVQVDMDGRILEHNWLYQEMLGYSKEELQHITYMDLTPLEWHELEARILREEVLPHGYSKVYEKAYRRKDGTVFPVELRTNLLTGDHGEPIGMWALIRDITERKRAEELLRQAERTARGTLDGLSEHIAILDQTGTILDVNEAWRRFASENPPLSNSVCEGANYYQVCARVAGADAGSAATFVAGIRDVMAGRRREYSQDYACHSPEVRRWFTGRVTRFTGEGPVRVVVAHQDITEKKAIEEQVNAAQVELRRLLTVADRSRRALLSLVEDQRLADEEIRRLNADLEGRVSSRTRELEAANQELEAFAYSVSHDLRAPLRHMDGFLSMLARHLGDGLDDKGRHYIEVAQQASVRMGLLVDGLLSFSRLGKVELRVQAVDTAQVVTSVIEEFQAESAGRVIRWTLGQLPVLHGDPTLIRLVFQNLLGNALKFTQSRLATEIELQPIAGLVGETGVWIRDNGVGFDPAYRHKLFGVFQRLHREEEFEGTGIGLANVHRIVSRHGGRVWAEGHPGQGAEFFVTLPIQGRQA